VVGEKEEGTTSGFEIIPLKLKEINFVNSSAPVKIQQREQESSFAAAKTSKTELVTILSSSNIYKFQCQIKSDRTKIHINLA